MCSCNLNVLSNISNVPLTVDASCKSTPFNSFSKIHEFKRNVHGMRHITPTDKLVSLLSGRLYSHKN